MKKFLFSFLTVVILGMAGLFYFITHSLSSVVQEQISIQGSKALNTNVEVSAVAIDIREGKGEIHGFKVSNPEGFSDTTALGFQTIRLDIGTEDLLTMPIVIEEIYIDSLATLFELNAAGQNNLNKLLNAVKQNQGKSDSSSQSPEKADTPAAESSESIRITINKILIKDTQLALDLTAVGGKQYDETLATFEVTQIGGKNGLPPEQLGNAISEAVLQQLAAKAKAKQVEKLKQKAIEKLSEKAGEGMRSLLDKLNNAE
ncbi:MAG: AsmA family protein [Pseudomonadales bacterium]|nr:AsmA family protein [Pseudomonadales bacterium]